MDLHTALSEEAEFKKEQVLNLKMKGKVIYSILSIASIFFCSGLVYTVLESDNMKTLQFDTRSAITLLLIVGSISSAIFFGIKWRKSELGTGVEILQYDLSCPIKRRQVYFSAIALDNSSVGITQLV